MNWTDREEKALKEGLRSLGFASSGEIPEKLSVFARELLLWNDAYRLVSISDPVEIVYRHILDSLAALPFLGNPGTLADVGSGAGLPGIPLAICLPDSKVSLVEKMGRRCDFLRNAVVVTGLAGRVEIIQTPLEKVRESFDTVTLRAFAPLQGVYDSLAGITSSGGRICAYKGRKESLMEELKDEWKAEVFPLTVPGLNAERNLVVLRK